MNVGFRDRVFRGIGGLALLVIDFLASGSWAWVFLIMGVWSVATSAFGWCPFYRLGGVNTCPVPQK